MMIEHRCPICGSLHGGRDGAEIAERDVQFARILNGRHWRIETTAPPKERDDQVPND